MKITTCTAVTLLCAALASGCVNGKLDPRVAPVVQAAAGGCALVPPTEMVGSVPGEQLCDVLAAVLTGALKLFSAMPVVVDAGTPNTQLEGVARNDVVIYVGPSRKAAHLRQKLATDAAFASQVDALLTGRK